LGSNPTDRYSYQDVYGAMYATRMYVLRQWSNYERLPLFNVDCNSVSEEEIKAHGSEAEGFVGAMKAADFRTLDEVTANMIVACLWDRFLVMREKEGYYFVIPRGRKGRSQRGPRTYYRPNYWQMLQYDISAFRRTMLIAITQVKRHISLRGILPSGIPLREALRHTEDGLAMLTDGLPDRFECPICAAKEPKPDWPYTFKAQSVFAEHLRIKHSAK